MKFERAKSVRVKSNPGVVIPSWKELLETHRPGTIAVDGYVKAPPMHFDRRGYLNLDHHYFCDRMATRASCMQAVFAVRGGLYSTSSYFGKNGRPSGDIRTQGADWDVGHTVCALTYPQVVYNAHFNELAGLEDRIDTMNGFYPVKNRWHRLRELAWIGESFTELRSLLHKEGRKAKPSEYLDVIEDQVERILLTLTGKGEERNPCVDYDVLARHEDWILVKEIGDFARYELARRGVDAFVTVAELGEREDVRYEYRVIRRSKFIGTFGSFESLARKLNLKEGYGPDSKVSWGGTDLCFCSPYNIGTSIPPDKFTAILEQENARSFE